MQYMDELTEPELVAALKSDDESVRLRAARLLWDRWFYEKGPEGFLALQQSDALVRAGDDAGAEAMLTGLVTGAADFAEAFNRRSMLRYRLGRFLEAIEDAEKVVALKPWHFGALHGLGLCHLARGDLLPAAAAFRRALDVQPHSEVDAQLLRRCLGKLN